MHFLGLSGLEWQEIGIAIAIVLVAAGVGRLVLFILDKGLSGVSRHTRSSFDNALVDAIRLPSFALILAIGVQIALQQLTFLSDTGNTNRENITFVLYVFVGYLFAHRLIDNMMQWYTREMARRTESRMDEQVLPFARRIALIILGIIAFIVVLAHFEVDVSAFVTTLGIGSLAIALAAQATLADTISGIVIMADRPFAIGNRIEILELDTWGDVLDIGLRSTRIRTRDNRLVIVPNSVIGKNLVVNHSVPSTVYRVQTHVAVAYGTDVDYARQVMIEAVRAQEWVMKEERIEALFIQWGDSAMIFRVRCWIENYVETRRIMDKLNSCLYKALNEAGIDSPFPTRTIYHRLAPEDRDGLVAVLNRTPAEGTSAAL
jgi:small-conductance mechanosensitive channel